MQTVSIMLSSNGVHCTCGVLKYSFRVLVLCLSIWIVCYFTLQRQDTLTFTQVQFLCNTEHYELNNVCHNRRQNNLFDVHYFHVQYLDDKHIENT